MPESFTELRQNDYERMCTGVPRGRIFANRRIAEFRTLMQPLLTFDAINPG